MAYRGSCHCGKIAFEVRGDLTAAVACNCSICSRKGALLWAVPHGDLAVAASKDALGEYTFNKHVIAHRFCKTCGIHPFAEDVDPAGNRMAYINVRCLEGVDPASITIMEFDGRSM